jgi:hypothetical protein
MGQSRHFDEMSVNSGLLPISDVSLRYDKRRYALPGACWAPGVRGVTSDRLRTVPRTKS